MGSRADIAILHLSGTNWNQSHQLLYWRNTTDGLRRPHLQSSDNIPAVSRCLGQRNLAHRLVAAGIEHTIALRLVEFLPIAYCRSIFADAGVRHCDCFRRKLADGELSAERPLDSEPVWSIMLSFARAEKRSGVTGKALLVIAARSSEFDAVNQLTNQGSKLEDIVLTPTVLQWPEEGPKL